MKENARKCMDDIKKSCIVLAPKEEKN